MTEMLSETLTTRQVAQLARLAEGTVRSHVWQHRVTGGRLGLRKRRLGSRVLHLADVLDWLDRIGRLPATLRPRLQQYLEAGEVVRRSQRGAAS